MSATTTLSHPSDLRRSTSSIIARFEDVPNERSLRVDSGEAAQGLLDTATAIGVLANSAVSELRLLTVDESNDEIRLSGQVSSFYHKQLAQETIRPIAEGRQVINRVKVIS